MSSAQDTKATGVEGRSPGGCDLHPGVESPRVAGHPEGDDRRARRSLQLGVVKDEGTLRAASAGPPGGAGQEMLLRLARAGLPAAIVVVIATAAGIHPGPGLHGRALGVSAAIGVLGAAGLAARWAEGKAGAHAALLGAVILSSAALVGLQRGPAGLATYAAVSAAAWGLPWPRSLVLAGVAFAANGLALGLGGAAHSGLGMAYTVGFNEVGVAAFYLVALMARWLREANDQAKDLLTELEATRDAQVRAAASSERQRLAREMHDVLAHSLSGLMLNLEGARLLANRAGAEPALTEALERAQRLARSGLEEARRAVGVLRGQDVPAPAQLAGLFSDFEAHSGIPCEFEVSGIDTELGPDARLAIFRVAQEALTNITRHARADRVEAQLSVSESGTRLVIEDFSSNAKDPIDCQRAGGYGLTGMRERAELLGGTLHAAPAQHGFRVELWLPA